MATNSINTINHGHRHSHRASRRRHSLDCPPSSSSSFFLRPTTTRTAAISYRTSSSTLPATTPAAAAAASTSQTGISYDVLEQHLAGKNFRQADEETRRLIIALAGDASVKRGYVFFSEVQFIPAADLRHIDSLWRKHSGGKFGYSVQKKIWNKVGKDFSKLFLKLGWMKKLDTEVLQYNYRAFPDEFTWEISDEVPDGHLPLTNALRGTQLFSSILSHLAFAEQEEEDAEEEEIQGKSGINTGEEKSRGFKNISTVFKPDYSF